MSRRTIVYHHRTRGAGVEGTHIRGMAESFARRGWNVAIISPPRIQVAESASAQNKQRKRSVWSVISDHSPEVLFELLELAYNLLSLRRISRTLNATGATVLYERYSLFHWAGTFIARRRGIPIVLEINDATVIVRSRPLVLRWLAGVIESWIFGNATHLITVSEWFKEAICRCHRIDSTRIHVMPNAVDPARFSAAATPCCPEVRPSIVLGMVGAFVQWHGLEFLVQSVGPFLKTTHSKLLLVGDGPNRANAEKCIDRMGIRASVELTGFVPASEIPGFLERMDICIMANSNEHGSPMKIFEYMAAGKPVLAPAYAPIREVITHRMNGWLFAPLHSSSLLEGVTALANDPDLRRQLGAAARETVLAKHTWDHRVREVESWIMSPART
jgi:glycosyltransferase involved in cell wall biosynthesis